MEFKSNAKYGEEPGNGSVFNLKNNNLKMSIHHYTGCGDAWFLSCGRLNINQRDLYTEDFKEAIEKSKEVIYHEISELIEEFNKIKGDTNIQIQRY